MTENAHNLDGRYSLADDGQIFWQADTSNPLPGNPVGKIAKGEAMLKPKADAEGHAKAQDWLDVHVRSVLEALFTLKQEEGAGALTAAAKDIGDRLYEHLGVMQRADLEDAIAKLDPELRKALRAKGVRLGPILAFLPALVKPAAVRMRAQLWALWNDKTLPIAQPKDGRVSEVVDVNAIDRNFYRMIGYPIFGTRAIRIDMLDRVVTDLYDAAKDGVFEAKHKYAEWLGCNLEDLHTILAAMGHRKIEETAVAPETLVTEQVEAVVAEASAAETPKVDAPEIAEPVAEVLATAKPQVPVAKFMLKRGKMSEGAQAKRERPERKPKPKFDPNKPQMLTEKDRERIKAREDERQKQKDSRPKSRDRDRDQDERPRKPRGKNERTESNEGRVYTFEGKKSDSDDNNPFAILKNLKK